MNTRKGELWTMIEVTSSHTKDTHAGSDDQWEDLVCAEPLVLLLWVSGLVSLGAGRKLKLSSESSSVES